MKRINRRLAAALSRHQWALAEQVAGIVQTSGHSIRKIGASPECPISKTTLYAMIAAVRLRARFPDLAVPYTIAAEVASLPAGERADVLEQIRRDKLSFRTVREVVRNRKRTRRELQLTPGPDQPVGSDHRND